MPRKIFFLIVVLMVPMAAEALVFPFVPPTFAATLPENPKPLVTLIVNSTIYKPIEASLIQYKTDVENDGFSVNITQTDQLSDKTARGIRAYLKERFLHGLVGAFLIGDIPETWFKVDNNIFPTDMYYRDLNGLWIDVDGDGVYEEHVGNTTPEIWVGRLKASPIVGNETSLINNYFVKNHRYRKGLRVLPWWRALAYIDDDGVNYAQDVNSSLRQVDTDVTVVKDPVTTNAQDYVSRIADPFGYQWVYLMCHGSFDFHTFMINDQPKGGTVYSYQYQTIDPRVFFYMLFVCSGARYTENEYLAGSAVLAQTYGLAAIGSTDTIYSVSFRKFFSDLANHGTIGSAFQDWFLEQGNWRNQLREGEDYRYMFYGLTIIGDPTLRLDVRPEKLHDVSVGDAQIAVLNVSNTYSAVVTATVKNYGDFNESVDLALYFDSYEVGSAHVSLSAKSYATVSIAIARPYRVVATRNVKTKLTLTASPIPEEFNLADNVDYVTLVDTAIVLPEPFQLSPWAATITILSVTVVLAIGIFKVIQSDFTVPSFLLKGKRYFMEKFSPKTEETEKTAESKEAL